MLPADGAPGGGRVAPGGRGVADELAGGGCAWAAAGGGLGSVGVAPGGGGGGLGDAGGGEGAIAKPWLDALAVATAGP